DAGEHAVVGRRAHAADQVGRVFLLRKPARALRRSTAQRQHVYGRSLGVAVLGRISVDRDEHVGLALARDASTVGQGNEYIAIAHQVGAQAWRRVDLSRQLAGDGQGDVLL